MATSSVEDKVNELLRRDVVVSRSRGAPNTDVEVAALLESIALTLLLNPKATVYLSLMARNGLLAQLAEEIAIVDNLLLIAGDLLNKKYLIKGRDVLERIRTSLLQMESLAKVSADSVQFKRFSAGVEEFVSVHLGKNVKKYGSKALTRSSAEAKKDFQLEYTLLRDSHTDLLDRLYALAVSIINFEFAPIGASVGVSTTTQARSDVENMIALLSTADEDTIIANAQQMALSLLTSRATLRVLGTLPSIQAPVVDDTTPPGYVLKAASASLLSPTTSITGPFTMVNPQGLTVTTTSGTATASSFPQVGISLVGKPFVVGAPITFPLDVSGLPDASTAYFCVSLTTAAAPHNKVTKTVSFSSGGDRADMAHVLAKLNTDLSGHVTALEYLTAGTSRIILVATTTYSAITVAGVDYSNLSFNDGNSDNSVAEQLGFTTWASNTTPAGTVDSTFITDAFQKFFPTLLAASVRGQRVTLVGNGLSDMTFSGTAVAPLHLPASVSSPGDKALTVSGVVNGVTTPSVDLRPYVAPGDLLTLNSKTYTVTAVEQTYLQLDSSLLVTTPTSFVVHSGIVATWNTVVNNLKNFLTTTWGGTDYVKNTDKLGLLFASVNSEPSPANVTAIKTELGRLRDLLVALQTAISIFTPRGGLPVEKKIIDGILNSLAERKMDRSLDYMLRGKIVEALGLDLDTSSFAGNVMKQMTTVVQKYGRYPNAALGDGFDPKVSRKVNP
jgi:hypothetical protein